MLHEIIGLLNPIAQAVCIILPVLEKIGPVLNGPKLDKVLTAIVKIVVAVAEMLGFDPGNLEKLGAKAQHSGLNPNDFETYDEYMKALNDYHLEAGVMEDIPFEVRLARGISVALQQIEDRFPVGVEDLLPELIVGKRVDFFSPARIAALLVSFSHADLAIRDMLKYFDNQLGVSDSLRVEDAMLDAEKKLKENAGKSDSELLEIIQQQWR